MNDVVNAMPGHPDPVGVDRVVFNIQGNKFRLICAIDFPHAIVFIKWFGTHAEYDRVDAATVSLPF